MPLTFRKSFRILPGVRLNINRRSWSITSGGKNGPRRTQQHGPPDHLDGSAGPLRLAAHHDQAPQARLRDRHPLGPPRCQISYVR